MNVEAISRAAVAWALAALLIATGTYYALLFTLAQYLQNGLGKSALVLGLTLVPWVAAFGVAGQLVRRLPERRLRLYDRLRDRRGRARRDELAPDS